MFDLVFNHRMDTDHQTGEKPRQPASGSNVSKLFTPPEINVLHIPFCFSGNSKIMHCGILNAVSPFDSLSTADHELKLNLKSIIQLDYYL